MGRPSEAADVLLAHALELVRLAEQQEELPFQLQVRRGGLEIVVRVAEVTGPVGEPPPAGLSPVERRVLGVLTAEWQEARTVARLAGRSPGYVRQALAALCEKNLAEYRARRGYRRAAGGA